MTAVSDRRGRMDLADALIKQFYDSWPDDSPPPPADDLLEALYHVQLLEATMSPDDPMFIEIRWTNGLLHMYLWDLEGQPENLTAAIDHYSSLLEWLPTAGFLPALGRLLLQRHDSDPAAHAGDLESAVNILRQARYLPDSDEAETMYLLGTALSTRVDAVAGTTDDWQADAEEAIKLLSAMPPRVDIDEDTENHVAYQLGRLFKRRHLTSDDDTATSDLEVAIGQLQYPADSDGAARYELASSFMLRFIRTDSEQDREDAIRHYEQICADPTAQDPVEVCGGDLSFLYVARAKDDVGLIDEVVASIESLLDRAVDQDGDMRFSIVDVLSCRVPPRRDEVIRVIELTDGLLADGVTADMGEPWLRVWRAMAMAQLALLDSDDSLLDPAIAALRTTGWQTREDDKTYIHLLETMSILVARRYRLPDADVEWFPLALLADFHRPDHIGLIPRFEQWYSSLPAGAPEAGLVLAAIAMLDEADFASQVEGVSTETALEISQDHINRLTAALAALQVGDPITVQLREQLGIRASGVARNTGDEDGYLRAISLFTELNAELPTQHPLRPEIVFFLGVTLYSAYNVRQMRVDLSATTASLDELLLAKDLPRGTRRAVLTLRGLIRAQIGAESQSTSLLCSAIGDYAVALRLLDEEGDGSIDVHGGLAIALLARHQLAGDRADLDYAFRHLDAAQEACGTDSSSFMSAETLQQYTDLALVLDQRTLTSGSLGALAPMFTAMHSKDPAAIRQAINDTYHSPQSMNDFLGPLGPMWTNILLMMKAAMDGDDMAFDEGFSQVRGTAAMDSYGSYVQAVASLFLGLACVFRAQVRDSSAALDEGIEAIEQALAAGIMATPAIAVPVGVLVDAYWRRNAPGDIDRGVEVSQLALRQQARLVLLQSSTDAGVQIAAQAAATAAQTAARCLQVGRVADAVAALESGRALALHAATSTSGLTTILYQQDHPELAAEWQSASRVSRGSPDVPDDLRHRVLDALHGSAAEARLLSPPSVGEIASALSVAGASRLVYLVPAQDDSPGRALLVSSTGEVDQLILPLLRVDDVFSGYSPQSGEGVEDLCDWAWEAAIGPLTRKLRTDTASTPPWIVIVACGALGVVPWHAARQRVAGGYRYFIAEAVVSYAASARQFQEVAYRPRLPVSGPMVHIVDPREPAFHLSEHWYLKKTCYPQSQIYGLESWGEAGRGTCSQLLAALPDSTSDGAAVLHLTCHGSSGAVPTQSHFSLDGSHVTAGEILRRAHGRPRNAPGGLVVAAACQSDLSLDAHDEALTLTTALLAAGATSVVGTKWSIHSQVSTILTTMFHRHLTIHGHSPVSALRATQLWALDPNRAVPPDLFKDLRGIPDRHDLSDVDKWAAFALHGR